ncbi:CRISPR-associated protein Cas4 [archaeon SCG-AAA382B04]|nr:CRISPR-associated protein Cas4 [archaeon SCG-AAA382B04]
MNDLVNPSLDLTGVEINYYFICKTKLWLFSNHVQMEDESELVKLGKLTHKESFEREEKEVNIGPIKFDYIRRRNKLEIHEVKKSKKMYESHLYQLLYYLYYLKQLGIEASGVLKYPRLREEKKVELTREKENEIKSLIQEVKDVLNRDSFPKPEWKEICKKCAYREFCFS